MSYENIIENLDAQRLGPAAVSELRKTRFIEGVVSGKTQTMAAIDAGYTGRDVRSPGKLVSPEEMRARFQQIAQEKGLTLHRVADKIAQHMDATQAVMVKGKGLEESNIPDSRVQQKAIEQLTQLLGMQDASKAAQSGSSITVSVTGAAADRLLAEFEDR